MPYKLHFILMLNIVSLLFLPEVIPAQERVKSITIRQFEIEEAIRNGLKYYLEPKDYVLRVKLFGEHRASSVAHESLPGFGQMSDPSSSTGEKYWEITRMRVDLVMHKEVSPSVNSYIGEIVPILSGLDYERGDEFVFVPIIPNMPAQQPVAEITEPLPPELEAKSEKPVPEPPAGLVKTDAQQPPAEKQAEPGQPLEKPGSFLQTLGLSEMIMIGGIVLLLLMLLWVLFSLSRIKANENETRRQLSQLQQFPALPAKLESADRETRDKMQQEREERVRSALVRDNNDRLLQDIVKQLVGRDDWSRELIQEMTKDKQSMDALTNLIATLGPEASRSLFRSQMSENAYMDLEQLARSVEQSPEDSSEVLNNIRMFLLTKQLVSPEKHFVDPFGFLKALSSGQISFLIKNEPARIKGIVIARLDSETAAEILQQLSRDERTQVAVELGRMNELPMELVEKVGYNLAEKARNVPDEHSIAIDGVRFVADVLSDSDPVTRQELINGLRVSDQKLSEDIENSCFVFDSIPVVPKDVLVEVVRQMPPDEVITAISGASKEIKEAIILCFPEKSRKALISSLKSKTPSRDEIRAARKQFVQSMREMSDAERVNLRDVNSAWVNQSSVPVLEEA